MENFGSWSILTTNFLLVLFLALAAVTFCSILHLANGKWRFQVRYLASSLTILFPIAFILLLVLLANGEATFPWLAHAHDEGSHLNGWHNYTFLVTRQIVGFLVVAGLFMLFVKYQHLSTIDDSYKIRRRFRNIALLIPFFYVLYGTMVAWDFEMTLIPSWHSASYGVYHFVSNFHAFLAFFAILIFFLMRSGKLTRPPEEKVLNYLAQMMLAFTILWTYFWFTQYLIMWYGRLPEEFGRFRGMIEGGLGGLWWTFYALKSLIPFCTFIFTNNRHNSYVIVTIAFGILIGTWIERYVWIAGSVDTTNAHIPMTSVIDIVLTLVVIAACWLSVRWSLNRYGLIRP